MEAVNVIRRGVRSALCRSDILSAAELIDDMDDDFVPADSVEQESRSLCFVLHVLHNRDGLRFVTPIFNEH